MKAAVIKKWGAPEVFEIQDINQPSPNHDQILIKVKTSSINPVDWKHRKGNHKLFMGSPFPIVLGYDVCGEVVEVGMHTDRFKVGDFVFGDLDNKYGGALANYALAHDNCVALKPENISCEEAAAFPLVSLTALQALRDKGNLTSGQTVLVNGAAGGVGHIAVQIARIMGAHVIAVGSEKNKELIMELGANEFIDYTKTDLTGIKTDIFFDVVGTYSFLKALKYLNPLGTYINPHPRPKILLHKLLQVFTKNMQVKTLLRKHNVDDLDLIAQWIKEGLLKVHIDKTFSLDDIGEAHKYAEQGKTKGKNVVLVSKK